MNQTPHLAVSLGDPCGIGPELLLKVLPAIARKWRVTVYGGRAALSLLSPGGIEYGFRDGCLRIGALEVPWLDPTPEISPSDLRLGQPSAPSGRCAVEAVRAAAADVMAGRADALLTLPISKSAAHSSGYRVPGHTELLQELTASPCVRMAFVSPSLKVVLHTIHQSLRSVIEGLDAVAVAETLTFAARQFARLFGKTQIRVALCAMNPHAGEGGAFGGEERMLDESIRIAASHFSSPSAAGPPEDESPRPMFFGPCPADTVFLSALRGAFAAVVALYHDQGPIPIKLVEPERAVNLTLGLPFIRVSPDHGTAFDIAGKWVANPSNTLAAADLALSLLR
jgi:4-hydroxythreonine-4-phosphate dehydrogenase